MKNEKKVKEWLDMLTEPEIIQRIKEICGGQEQIPVTARAIKEGAAYRQQAIRLEAELEQARNTLSDNQETIQKQNQVIDELNRKFTAVKNEIEFNQRTYAKESEKYRDAIQSLQIEKGTLENENHTLRTLAIHFQKPLSLYQKFKILDSGLQRNLAGIISVQNPLAFISSLSRYENLESLWEYIKYLIGNGNGAEVPILKEIFVYFFQLVNESSEKGAYALSEVKIGSRYDDERHIRGFNSAAQGTVREVQLPGYYSVNTGKIIKKTVVKAE